MTATATPTTSPVVSESSSDDDSIYAHIIRKSDEMRGYTGETITALCGKTWVPSRDPDKFPTCPTCEAILKRIRSAPSN